MPMQLPAPAADDRVGFEGPFTTDQISPRRHLTPEGFLLCMDVPVARTGTMTYGPGEVPVEVGKSGYALVERDEDALQDPDALNSLIGKPVTDEHPATGELVTPETWAKLSKGVVLNPRAVDDVILCDLLITDKKTIENVQAGKVEVSAGYEADYEDHGDGYGQQTNIIFNHVALVERGRCGPRCAIGDHDSTENQMATPATKTVTVKHPAPAPKRQTFMDRLRALVRDADMEEEQATTQDETAGESGATHIHVHVGGDLPAAATPEDAKAIKANAGGDTVLDEAAPEAAAAVAGSVEGRLTALETGIGEIKALLVKLAQAEADETKAATTPAATTDEVDPEAAPEAAPEADTTRAATGDSAALATSYNQVLADAAVLVPGFRMATFDAKVARAATVDTMCAARRRALDITMATGDGLALVTAVSGGATPDLAKMDCAATAVLFNAAAGAKKLANNRAAIGDANRLPDVVDRAETDPGVVGPVGSPAALNDYYAKFYGQK